MTTLKFFTSWDEDASVALPSISIKQPPESPVDKLYGFQSYKHRRVYPVIFDTETEALAFAEGKTVNIEHREYCGEWWVWT